MSVRWDFKVLLYIVITSCIQSFVVFAQSCLEEDLERCMAELKALNTQDNLPFATTEKEVNLTCRHLKEAMDCVNSFTGRCFDSNQREVFKALSSGPQELIIDLCTPGSQFRIDYLRHSVCYRNLKNEFKECTETYSESQETAKNYNVANNDKLRIACCNFGAYQECIISNIASRCSAEAVAVGRKIASKSGGHLVKSYCSQYRHDGPECNSAEIHKMSCWIVLMTLLLAFASSGQQR